MRQIVLDTETTGLDPAQGHRVIEIGCVELLDRRFTGNNFHRYLHPDREIDAGALRVHGITNTFLRSQPRFGDIAESFLRYIQGAELIIHNAPFDLGFLNAELDRWRRGAPKIEAICKVIDTLILAREKHPGRRNTLDALCKRYGVDNRNRKLHGALLDAQLLAQVYLEMTGGQVSLDLAHKKQETAAPARWFTERAAHPLRVIRATEAELTAHRKRLQAIDEASGGRCLWLQEDT